MAKIEREILLKLLDNAFSISDTFNRIEGKNPCLISFEGAEYYVYIKNLSPAQLSNNNPDIWRIQLPIREEFEAIKINLLPFILLGYDGDNDIYTTWNPYWVKQRLNVAKSVSFYSRLSLQENARTSNQFQRQELNNDGEVIAFPREKLPHFIVNIEKFFPDVSEYIAMGSRKRTDANASYKYFSDAKNIANFAQHLSLMGLSHTTISNYCCAVSKLINEGYISSNRKIFLACNSIAEYPQTLECFFSMPEIKVINEEWHYTYSAALGKYIDYLMQVCNVKEEEDIVSEENQESKQWEDKEQYGELDWEVDFINEQSKLTRIANPKLIDILRPILDTEYRSPVKAFNAIEDFYPDLSIRFPAMEINDWMKLLDKIDWSNPYYLPNKCSIKNKEELNGKRKLHILRVTFPDGSIVQEKKVSDTLVNVVKYAGAEYVRNLNICTCGENLIVSDRDINPLYAKATKHIEKDLYVNTCNDTETKYNIINKISNDLDLNLRVNYISVDDNKVVYVYPTTSTRAKIKVTFPNGKIIQYAKVLETLIEVIQYAGVKNVRKLDIRVNNDNLVTDYVTPHYRISLKPLGNGFFVHTNSRTDVKMKQIEQISNDLHLDLIVELVE